jgi:uroporphyrinogen-III synthase
MEEAAAKGITFHVIPFIGTSPVTQQELDSRLQELDSRLQEQATPSQTPSTRRLVAIFTSVSAVDAVAKWLKTATANPPWEIFCTSCATLDKARDTFGSNAIAGTADSARELAEVIMQKKGPGDGREVFFFCGDLRRDELPDLLKRNGFEVNERIVYQTILTPQPALDKYDGIVFFSPSAVESFFSINTVAPGTRMFAIGATTANAIKARCDNAVVISGRPEKATMIRQVIDYFQTNNIYY